MQKTDLSDLTEVDRATWPEACLSRCVSQIGLGVEDDIMLAGWMVYIFEDDI